MIKKQNNDILNICINGQKVLSVYTQGQLVWSNEIPSCFANGYWIDTYPWTNNTPWYNNRK